MLELSAIFPENENCSPEVTMSQEETVKQATEAAAAGDPVGMAEALYRGHVIDGLVRRIHARWSVLGYQGAEDAVASAVEILYTAVRQGEKILSPVGFLWKVADTKANDAWRAAERETHLESWEQVADEMDSYAVVEQEEGLGLDEDSEREEKRAMAVRMARKLLPRLGQQNMQAVMAYVIDAVDAGRWDVPNQEIKEALGLSNDTVRTSLSRGFRRLSRLAQEEGLAEELLVEANIVQPQEEEEEYNK